MRRWGRFRARGAAQTLRTAAPGLLLVATLVACSSTGDPDFAPAVLLVDESVAEAGDTLSIRLVNASDVAIGYNLCFAVLERRTGSAWQAAEQGRSCFTIQYVLRPRQQVVEPRVLPPGIPAGVYRFRLNAVLVTRGSETPIALTSPDFMVQ
jgi:hypothetical protein